MARTFRLWMASATLLATTTLFSVAANAQHQVPIAGPANADAFSGQAADTRDIAPSLPSATRRQPQGMENNGEIFSNLRARRGQVISLNGISNGTVRLVNAQGNTVWSGSGSLPTSNLPSGVYRLHPHAKDPNAFPITMVVE